MRTIKEIKSIEVILEDDRNHFNIKFNGEAVDDYRLELTKENILHAARSLTRLSNFFWDTLDALTNEEKKKEE